MGGINQSLFLLGVLFIGQGSIPGQGSAAVVLLGVGLLLSWMATPGWTELILMYPNRVGGIAATCAEAFRPYSPILANLTGVCYWWGWVPTCGLTALLAASAINQWYLPWLPVPLMATCIVLFFTIINLCGVKWVMRLAIPIATASAALAFVSALAPIFSGSVDWQQAFTFQLTVPFPGWFGQVTSVMAGLYIIGFAAPAFEQAACHVGETINPNKNVPRAMFVSAGLATLYFVALPIVWLGALGPEAMGKELALVLGPTFAPLLGAAAKATAIWFMIFNMLHGTIAALAGSSRTLSQLAEDGLLPEFLAKRSRTDAPWTATLVTSGMAIAFLLIGDPLWLIAAANLTYLIGIAMPSVAVWLLRHNEPQMERPYRAPRGMIVLGLCAAGGWALTAILGFQQFGLPTVLIGLAFAYSGAVLYAWRKFSDRRKAGLPGIARTLHLKLTGAMLLVLLLDAAGYLIAVEHVPKNNTGLIAALEDIFVVVALLTISVGLILPGMIAHSAVEVSKAVDKLVNETLADFSRAMRALAAGDLEGAKARFDMAPVVVHSHDEVGEMALNFNRLQAEIGRAAGGLKGAREGLSQARNALTETNERLSLELAERFHAQRELRVAHEELETRVVERTAELTEEVAERRQAEQALRAAEAKYRALVEQLPAITYHRTLGKICTWSYVSPQIETLLGFTPEEWLASDYLWRDQINPDDLPGALAAQEFSQQKGEYLAEYRMTTRDGELRWFRDQAVFVPGAEPGRDVLYGVMLDITEGKAAEALLAEINARLVDASRKAGMAEVATGVLHNVGNVLNSVNVSALIVAKKLQQSKAAGLERLAALLISKDEAIPEYLTRDPDGRKIPEYLEKLGQHLVARDGEILSEIELLHENIKHINRIVAMQQDYAKMGGALEILPLAEIVDDALALNLDSFHRHGITVERHFSPLPAVPVDRHKTLQIVINLLQNAKHALVDSRHPHKALRIFISMDQDHACIAIADNGIGIPPENMDRIFRHGFTTRENGHGFGLHSCANAAAEMGGTLCVESSEVGQGATFTLKLPLVQPTTSPT